MLLIRSPNTRIYTGRTNEFYFSRIPSPPILAGQRHEWLSCTVSVFHHDPTFLFGFHSLPRQPNRGYNSYIEYDGEHESTFEQVKHTFMAGQKDIVTLSEPYNPHGVSNKEGKRTK